MKHLFRFLSILLVLMLGACTNDETELVVDGEEEVVVEPVEEVVTFELTSTESRAAADILGFNQAFFKAVVASHSEQSNVVCSPLSASVLLSMMANATEGEVRTEIIEALGCEDLTSLNSLNKKYLKILPCVDSSVTFTNANSLWYDQNYIILPEFAKVIENYYDAKQYARDFSNSSILVNEINGWCEEKTNNIINNLISELPTEAASVLANAIYFNGAWSFPFKKEETSEMSFFGVNGETTVDMMVRKKAISNLIREEYDAIKYPYGEGLFEAYFILPKTNIDDFIASTDFEEITSTTFPISCIDFYLPKCKISPSSPLQLNKAFSTLGIPSLNGPADISMFTTKLKKFHQFYQKTGVEFTEEGAEATSVTMLAWASGIGDDNYVMKFDRPFVFLIRETTAGAMLFAGKISEL